MFLSKRDLQNQIDKLMDRVISLENKPRADALIAEARQLGYVETLQYYKAEIHIGRTIILLSLDRFELEILVPLRKAACEKHIKKEGAV